MDGPEALACPRIGESAGAVESDDPVSIDALGSGTGDSTSDGEAEVRSFDLEVVPLLTKLGCNAGACHGSAAGRGNFRLSLLGSDPAADHRAITRDLQGRRVNLQRPSASLLLRKPWAELEHGGGMVLDREGSDSARLLSWLEAGAPRGIPHRVQDLNFWLEDSSFEQLPQSLAWRVFAQLDGEPAPRDVTADVTIVSLDPTAVQMAGDQLQVFRRGQHVVLARYLNQVTARQIAVPFSTIPVKDLESPAIDWVDRHIVAKWRLMGLSPALPADDSAWLRRLYLDLTGQLPPPEATLEYLSDSNPQKRAAVVDRLLASPEFTIYWTWKSAQWLQIRSVPNDPQAFERYREWLRDQVDRDVGWDEILRQVLTVDGDSHREGPANFSRQARDARDQAEQVSQIFAGIRLECANCHDHPLDRWTQDDYHGFAAIFARVQRGRVVGLAQRGQVTNLRTQQPAVPRIPGQRDLELELDQRAQVVAWLLDAEHHYLARVMVNRLWQSLFGRGLVEPIDDLRPTNPATHPELLSALAVDFADHGYRIRHTLRWLALSETYALGSAHLPTHPADDRFYAWALPRPLEPEVLVDAISQVTGVREVFDAHRTDRALAVLDRNLPAPSLDALGRLCLATTCRGSAMGPAGLAAELSLLNGDVINRRIRSPEGRLAQGLRHGESIETLVCHFYLSALCRLPTDSELAVWTSHLNAADPDDQRARLEDFLWSLLNSRAFTER